MRPGTSFGNSRISAIAGVAARWLLGGLFLYVGLSKAFHPVDFLKLARQYEMVSSPLLLNSIAAALPWFEVCCGLLLLTGVAVRGTSVMLLAMLAPLTVLVVKRALGIQAALGIPFSAVKFDCGCGMGEVFICHKLIENGLLMVLSAWLLAGHGRRLCARYSLLRLEVNERL
jgi:uncharacterized membrane protein YphA (DoxX/SURF4 family)